MIGRVVVICVILGWAAPAIAQLRVDAAERDQIVSIDHDSPEIADAVRKAQATLAAFFALAENPLLEMDSFAIKMGVPTRRGTEYIWISDFRRANGRVTGRIDNTPRWTAKIKEGQIITFQENRIIDWLYVDGDRMKGNFTACALNKMSSAAEAKAMEDRFRMACEE